MYIIINVPYSYDLLLGRPSLNKLKAVVSTTHLKMKFPNSDSKMVTMRVDKKFARECHEKSLKTRQSMYCIATLANSDIIELDHLIIYENRRL